MTDSSTTQEDKYTKARQQIDEIHNEDPTGQEIIYADNVEKFLRILVAPEEPTQVQILAARCQHLRRFAYPRSNYPPDRTGYLKWRKELYTIQANLSTQILSSPTISLPESEIQEIYNAVAKKDLLIKSKVHPTTTLLEDAAVLVFLESEIEGFSKQHEEYSEEKWVGIIRKTWRKLSSRGREEALKLVPEIEEGLRGVIVKAVTEEEEKEKERRGGE